jgi:ribokinase
MEQKGNEKRIIVIGSSNTDMVIQSDKLPLPGETVLGGDLIMNAGGKGANQAVAAAKLGGNVTFIAKVGDDQFGNSAIREFEEVGIDSRYVVKDPERPSGVALIMVDQNGENCISAALGANQSLNAQDIDRAESIFKESSYILVQLEVPLSTIEYASSKAKALDIPVVLNPAPAQPLTNDLYRNVHIITPNETETELLTGIQLDNEEQLKLAGQYFRNKGVSIVIITLGSRGAYVLSEEVDEIIPGFSAEVKDTTAAGDTFNGALVVALSEGKSIQTAVQFANKAASVSVTRMGAQQSIPLRNELDK